MAIPLRPQPGLLPNPAAVAPPVVPPAIPRPVPGQSAGSLDFMSWLQRLAGGGSYSGRKPVFDQAARKAVSAQFRAGGGQFPLLQQLASGAGGLGSAPAPAAPSSSGSSPYSGFMSFLASLRR